MSPVEAGGPSAAALWREGLRERLAGGGGVVLLAQGHSMWPLHRDGRHVVVAGLDAPQGRLTCGRPVIGLRTRFVRTGPSLRVGDVVLARGERGPTVLHRVVGLRRDAALLKGDANPRADGWVPHDHLVGRADPGPAPRLVAALSRFAGPWLARALGRLRTQGFLTLCQVTRKGPDEPGAEPDEGPDASAGLSC